MRRTWAPKGRTPVLRHPYRRGKQISMCGLVAYRPGAGQSEPPAAWMGFDLLEGRLQQQAVYSRAGRAGLPSSATSR